VRDTRTGLECVAGPDKDTTWDEANSWVQSLNLNGGGWRMPTTDELEGLYERIGRSGHNNIALEENWLWVWSVETTAFSHLANVFNPYVGTQSMDRSESGLLRAFAVRSRSDGYCVNNS